MYGREELAEEWEEARGIKDRVVENGKVWWLVEWAGKDDDDNAWPDSWEPTKNVFRPLAAHRRVLGVAAR